MGGGHVGPTGMQYFFFIAAAYSASAHLLHPGGGYSYVLVCYRHFYYKKFVGLVSFVVNCFVF